MPLPLALLPFIPSIASFGMGLFANRNSPQNYAAQAQALYSPQAWQARFMQNLRHQQNMDWYRGALQQYGANAQATNARLRKSLGSTFAGDPAAMGIQASFNSTPVVSLASQNAQGATDAQTQGMFNTLMGQAQYATAPSRRDQFFGAAVNALGAIPQFQRQTAATPPPQSAFTLPAFTPQMPRWMPPIPSPGTPMWGAGQFQQNPYVPTSLLPYRR